MGAPMKTTIEIPDALFRKARRHAEARRTTLKALVEQGLRTVLAEARQQVAFQLPDASVGGDGLSPEFRDADWNHIRAAAYEGHGG
ncbi:MAG: type II toxin-antitoxin system VapB family antitoxin [Xanthomonadales bacterium]|nr:type II toxin-antitoxin system VapB family antitoxin [Xanthomonadales bacterium]